MSMSGDEVEFYRALEQVREVLQAGPLFDRLVREHPGKAGRMVSAAGSLLVEAGRLLAFAEQSAPGKVELESGSAPVQSRDGGGELGPDPAVDQYGRLGVDAMWTLEEGSVPSEKRCYFCGGGNAVLSWRPSPERLSSSPTTEPGWFPGEPVREAKVSCPGCGNASYGLLVCARVGPGSVGVVGQLVAVPDARRW